MKIAKNILWAVGFLVLFIGLGLLIASLAGEKEYKLPGYIVIICSSLLFLTIFIIEFVSTMVLKETAGDEYNFISKTKAIEILDAKGIKYEKGQHKDYYLTLLRLHKEKADKNG